MFWCESRVAFYSTGNFQLPSEGTVIWKLLSLLFLLVQRRRIWLSWRVVDLARRIRLRWSVMNFVREIWLLRSVFLLKGWVWYNWILWWSFLYNSIVLFKLSCFIIGLRCFDEILVALSIWFVIILWGLTRSLFLRIACARAHETIPQLTFFRLRIVFVQGDI